MDHVCADVVLVLTRIRRVSVVLTEGYNTAFWFAQVLALFHVQQNRFQSDKEQFSFRRYFAVTPPLDNVNKIPSLRVSAVGNIRWG